MMYEDALRLSVGTPVLAYVPGEKEMIGVLALDEMWVRGPVQTVLERASPYDGVAEPGCLIQLLVTETNNEQFHPVGSLQVFHSDWVTPVYP